MRAVISSNFFMPRFEPSSPPDSYSGDSATRPLYLPSRMTPSFRQCAGQLVQEECRFQKVRAASSPPMFTTSGYHVVWKFFVMSEPWRKCLSSIRPPVPQRLSPSHASPAMLISLPVLAAARNLALSTTGTAYFVPRTAKPLSFLSPKTGPVLLRDAARKRSTITLAWRAPFSPAGPMTAVRISGSFISLIIISWASSVVFPHIFEASLNSTLSFTTANQVGFLALPLM
ncbi:MAG: hypothetical protein A4E67_00168 [Syntrophaceae bacterium PtaB.Bin038]|nr:MAG: hypothetical protein A4E67_00168 [Syntrophaceae bacterium PtaB.Bin038]